MSKAILSVLQFDILQAAGVSQLCTGQDSGCEAAIHAVSFFQLKALLRGTQCA